MTSWIRNFYVKYKSIVQYVVFAIFTSALHVFVFSVSHYFVDSLVICNIVSYAFSTLLSFFLNKKVVFKNTSNQYGMQLVKYLLVKFTSFVVDTVILMILTQWLSVPTLLSKLIANCSTTLNNYVFNKKFVFSKK